MEQLSSIRIIFFILCGLILLTIQPNLDFGKGDEYSEEDQIQKNEDTYPMNNLLKNKKLISFDGDGTLWYPKETKRSVPPHGVYALFPDTYLDHLELTPGALELLTYLSEQENVKVAIISTHPHPYDEALKILGEKIRHFNLEKLCDFFSPSPDLPEGKGPVLKKYLDEMGLENDEAVHIGDSIRYDYDAMKNIDVDVILIDAPYNDVLESATRIRDLGDLMPDPSTSDAKAL
jgi:phosphoglycolate phosphatase-like HAD superfamily hydrolase